MRVLLLGGTQEANRMAAALAGAGLDAIYSYAGRTRAPGATPLPTRVGGFGGVAGLRGFLATERITHVVDATHPFAAAISTHAVAACAAEGVGLMALERPEWVPGPGDRWTGVADLDGALGALPAEPTRIFLAIGRQEVDRFRAAPQHHYLLRVVDRPDRPPDLTRHEVITARGPFEAEADRALLKTHGIELVVSKNAGGQGAEAKITAARELGLPVIMIARPTVPNRTVLTRVAEVMAHLGHARLGV